MNILTVHGPLNVKKNLEESTPPHR